MAKPMKRREFDKAKLEKLAQPFNVTVEQDVGGRRTPVDLPPVDKGLERGKGFTPDAAAELGGVLPRLGGGGLYICKAYDDVGNVEEWEWWYDPTVLPRHATSAVQSAAAAHQQPIAQPQAPQPPYQGGQIPTQGMSPQAQPAFAPFAWWHQANAPQPPQAPPYQPPPGGWFPAIERSAAPAPAPAAAPVDPFGNPLWQEREKSLRLEYEMKLQQASAAARAELAATAQRLEQGQVAAQQAQQAMLRPAIDPGIEARIAAAEQRAAEADQRAQRAEERATRDRERSEMLGAVAALEQRVGASLEQLAAKLAQASHAPGPDPTIMLLTETIKANAELNRETLRSITDSMKDTSKAQMTFSDVMLAMRQMNDQSGASTVTKQLSENYSSMLGMVREIIELNSQMRGPGENPLVGMGTEAISKVSEGVQAYIQSKRDEAVAKEHASALRAQAQAASNAAVANANAHAMRPAPVAPAPPAPQPAQTTAPTEADEGAPVEERTEGETIEGAAVEVPANGNGAGEMQIDPRERRIFGAAAESIMHLRAGVMTGKLTPLQVAQAIAQGAARLRALKLTPPVFRMYDEKIYAQVVEALLPEAAPDFRRAVTEILNSAARMEAEEAAAPEPVPAN